MYQGDGSYKTTSYQLEKSFQELLDIEFEYVNKYNAAVRAYEIARKNGMRTVEYEIDIERLANKLGESRKEIREYCEKNINLKTSVAELMYKM